MGVLFFDGCDVAEFAVQSSVVEPVDVLGDSDLEVVDPFPRATVADQFGFEERIERFGQGIVVTIALGANGGDGFRVGEALGIANGTILNAPVRVMYLSI